LRDCLTNLKVSSLKLKTTVDLFEEFSDSQSKLEEMIPVISVNQSSKQEETLNEKENESDDIEVIVNTKSDNKENKAPSEKVDVSASQTEPVRT